MRHALFNKMKINRIKRDAEEGDQDASNLLAKLDNPNVEPPVASLFNRTVEEETKTISTVAHTFERKNEYARKFKKRELSTNKHGEVYDEDPRIRYYKKCTEE